MTENELIDSLKQNFGFSEFRAGQLPIIQQLLLGSSALAVFPTGSGKSLCYQLPALHFSGLTLVVSPLIALMKDQVDFLKSKGIAAEKMDSTLNAQEVRQLWDNIHSGKMKLLFISPERIANEKFFQQISQVSLSMMVIDEAHCMSEWGHNFRPDYLKLKEFADALKVEKVLNLTATATPKVASDICAQFNIPREAYVNTGFHRPNLEIHSTPCSQGEKKALLLRRISERNAGATVVYVTLQKQAEDIAEFLTENGFPSTAYHAGLKPELRDEVQNHFMSSDKAIVVATIAFGMGIDKSNIRYVYHFNLPKSMENYSQEIGRAGRDGGASVCEIFSSDSDRIVLENFTYGDTPTRQSIHSVLQSLIKGDRFDISLYQLSVDHDVRQLVLSTMLCYLELQGVIKSIGQFYDSIKFKPQLSSKEMLGRFDQNRQKFLKTLFSKVKKGRTWFSINITSTAAETGFPRKKITDAFNYLDNQNLIEMQVRDFRKSYRVLQQNVDIAQLSDQLYQRFQEAESRDIERIHFFTEFTRSPNCLVQAKLKYFGEQIQACGHCDRCLGKYQAIEVPLVRRQLNDAEKGIIQEMRSQNHEALQHPRQLAKFLCGITSPAASRVRPPLSRHEKFGVLGHLPFGEILKTCE